MERAFSEFPVNGHVYKVGRLSAKQQFHVSRRLAPVVTSLGRVGNLAALRPLVGAVPGEGAGDVTEELGNLAPFMQALGPVMDAIAALPDRDCDFILDTCLGVCQRRQAGDLGWAPVQVAGRTMFEDIDLPAMLRLVAQVLRENMSGFFPALPSTSSAPPQ